MLLDEHVKGPFILWQRFDEGWRPRSFQSLKEAYEANKERREWIVTRPIKLTVIG